MLFPTNDGIIWRISSVRLLSFQALISSNYHSTLRTVRNHRETYKHGPTLDDDDSLLDYDLSPRVK